MHTPGPTQSSKQHEDEATNEDQVVSTPWQPLVLVLGLHGFGGVKPVIRDSALKSKVHPAYQDQHVRPLKEAQEGCMGLRELPDRLALFLMAQIAEAKGHAFAAAGAPVCI